MQTGCAARRFPLAVLALVRERGSGPVIWPTPCSLPGDGGTIRRAGCWMWAPEVVGLAARLLKPGGTAVLGLSRRAQPPERTTDLMEIGRTLGLEPGLVA